MYCATVTFVQQHQPTLNRSELPFREVSSITAFLYQGERTTSCTRSCAGHSRNEWFIMHAHRLAVADGDRAPDAYLSLPTAPGCIKPLAFHVLMLITAISDWCHTSAAPFVIQFVRSATLKTEFQPVGSPIVMAQMRLSHSRVCPTMTAARMSTALPRPGKQAQPVGLSRTLHGACRYDTCLVSSRNMCTFAPMRYQGMLPRSFVPPHGGRSPRQGQQPGGPCIHRGPEHCEDHPSGPQAAGAQPALHQRHLMHRISSS